MKENKTVLSPKNHKSNGQFAKGNNANPSGRNGFMSVQSLIAALEDKFKKLPQGFWGHVAKRCVKNDTVLIALLKKLIPDKLSAEHSGQLILNLQKLVEDANRNNTEAKNRLVGVMEN